ncbi:hypothetical protein [Muribaculum intestinale]|uniref:hypothetical protein n=1 Tax=Muribaculum intestinale TaxID=1796646 RepID=UPI0023CED1CD|nr:hypothetical protein [Muribaculum intestinale]MDE6282399.1 hypothetical protein [Muribaculaceae bacterium]
MARLNFQQFRIPTGIDRTQYRTGDARESVANMLYLNVNGIRAHALALKIYNSEGETDYTDEEVRSLTEVAANYGTPAFIDGLNEQINNQTKTD